MEKVSQKNIEISITSPRGGMELISASTTRFSLGLRLTNRGGRRTRIIFRGCNKLWPLIKAAMDVMTMVRSSSFHPSRRYVLFSMTNPMARISMHISPRNSADRTRLTFARARERFPDPLCVLSLGRSLPRSGSDGVYRSMRGSLVWGWPRLMFLALRRDTELL